MTRAVTRSLTVLELLAASQEPLEVSEIIARSGITRATGHRLMQSLQRDGYVVREKDGTYRVSFRLWGLAAAMLSSHGIRDVALPHMIELASALQLQVALTFFEEGEACYTDRIEVIGERVSPRLINIRVPALSVAAGRALAAYLPEEETEPMLHDVPQRTPLTKTDPAELRAELRRIRAEGYALLDREYDPNGSGVAVPIFDRQGRAVAAFSVVIWGPLTPETVQRVLPPALTAGRRTSAELGYRASDPVPVS